MILKRLISHLVIQNEDVVILDMEAGLEHLGRGTTSFMESFIVVVEPVHAAYRRIKRSESWRRNWAYRKSAL